MPSTQTTSTFGLEDPNPWRLILQLGLGLVCLVVGGFGAVGFFGPRIMGASLASSHFSTLNNRIEGFFELDRSRLSWMDPGSIEGLRLVGSDKQEVLRGNLVVPRLLDWFSEGLIPGQATVNLELLRLNMDDQGRFNLLENLIARSGASQVSPFFDGAMLEHAVEYEGRIDQLIFEDQRAGAGSITVADSTFEMGWSPTGAGKLILNLGAGTLEANLRWQGMGETFDLASLRGQIVYDGESADMEKWLGFPGGITGSMQDNLRAKIVFPGPEEEGDGTNVPVEVQISEILIRGEFDGHSFRMTPGEMPASLGMRRFQGLDGLLAGLSRGLPDALRDKVRLAIDDSVSWKWMLKSLQSGITPIDHSLPFLEGWLASSRLSLGYEMMPGLNLSGPGNGGDKLELGKSTLDWRYDPELGRGEGNLTAQMPALPDTGNLALLGVSRKLLKAFELDWKGTSPLPSKQAALESCSLSHTLTRFFTSYLPGWGASLPRILGESCSLEIHRMDTSSPAPEHGGLVPGWKAIVKGAKTTIGEELILFAGGGALWTNPNQSRTLPLQPDQHPGIYGAFFSRFLPWFAELSANGEGEESGELLVEVSNLVFRRPESDRQGLDWKLEEGLVQFFQMDDVDYRIQPGWKGIWGGEVVGELDPIAFDVSDGRVSFEQLTFPVGTFTGDIDLVNGVVDLSLIRVSPLLAVLQGEFQGFARGVKVTGSVNKPECTKPMTPVAPGG